MTKSTTQDNEDRLIYACEMLIGRHVQQQLPEERRGILSVDYVRKNAKHLVIEALNSVVKELLERIDIEVPMVRSPERRSGELKILDNTNPCSTCRKVKSLATLLYRGGIVVQVECEDCVAKKITR